MTMTITATLRQNCLGRASVLRGLSPLADLAAPAPGHDELILSPRQPAEEQSWAPPASSRIGLGALAVVGALSALSGCASMPNNVMPAVQPSAQVMLKSQTEQKPATLMATLREAAEAAAAAEAEAKKAIEAAAAAEAAAKEAMEAQPEKMGMVEGSPAEPCPTQLCQKVIRYDPHIEAASERFQVDPNLIRGVIAQESQGNPRAGSPKGAKGLMQLMSDTAREMGVKNRTDPQQNIFGGTRYLSEQLESNGGDVERALWAYNAGPGNLAKGVKPAETRNYIESVLEYARQFRDFIKHTVD